MNPAPPVTRARRRRPMSPFPDIAAHSRRSCNKGQPQRLLRRRRDAHRHSLGSGAMNSRRALADRVLVGLFRTFPPRHTIFKESGARPAQEYADECRLPLWRYFGSTSEMFRGRDVLDVGCAYGGRTVRFAELGARTAVGVDIKPEMVAVATAFAADRGADNASFRLGADEAIPADDGSADLIVMNDVLEHVVSPRSILRECRRVLRPGGLAAIVFPPYYDVSAGSHLD